MLVRGARHHGAPPRPRARRRRRRAAAPAAGPGRHRGDRGHQGRARRGGGVRPRRRVGRGFGLHVRVL
uniref:Uncharacterized protein n=1 Tax=Arundo donax TaxID=35708 RepID=A0A0A8YEZ1_ARUDO